MPEIADNVRTHSTSLNRRWLRLCDFLVGERALLESVVYAGLPPAMTDWQAQRDNKEQIPARLCSLGFQAQNRALKLPVIVWQDGEVVEKPV